MAASKLITNGSNDYKWTIDKDGYYKITVDAFRETIKAEYLGTSIPTAITNVKDNASVNSYTYNMSGQVVEDSYNGIIIKDNKKLLNNK